MTAPMFVEARSLPTAIEDDCFINVQKQVAAKGGEIQHGWTIWEWPGIALDAEFHAVWRSLDGSFLDVSPKKDGETRIVFLPDSQRVFKGERVDNIRHAVGHDPRIKEWIHAHEQFQKALDVLMKGMPFGTRFHLDEKTSLLHERCARLEIALTQSRAALRSADK